MVKAKVKQVTVESLRAEKEPLIKLLTPWMSKNALQGYDPNNLGHHWFVSTRVGVLRVIPEDDWIACRFEGDLTAAKKHFGVRHDPAAGRLNPFSGKWNWHVWEAVPYRKNGSRYTEAELAKLVEMFLADLEKIHTKMKAGEIKASDAKPGDLYRDGVTGDMYMLSHRNTWELIGRMP